MLLECVLPVEPQRRTAARVSVATAASSLVKLTSSLVPLQVAGRLGWVMLKREPGWTWPRCELGSICLALCSCDPSTRRQACPPHARVTPLRHGGWSATAESSLGESRLCVTVADWSLPSPASARWGGWRCLSEKKNLSSVHNELSPEAMGHTILPLF